MNFASFSDKSGPIAIINNLKPKEMQAPQTMNVPAHQPNKIDLGGDYRGDGHGLTLSKQIHSEYGEAFQKNPVDNASGYAGCLKCCGSVQ
jgi:hypothetical protein